MNFFIKSKKRFLFYFFLGLGFLFTINFYHIRDQNDPSLQGVKNLKSPCRGLVSKKSLKKQKKIIFSKRADQLNQLMETPIDWIFKDIKGDSFDLYCYRGKKGVVINLWATWCPPCIKELPSLSALADKAVKDFLVIAITTESLEVVNPFIQKSFSDLSERLKIVRMSPEELSEYFPQDSLPVTYLFARNGKLKSKIMGDRNWLNMGLIKK